MKEMTMPQCNGRQLKEENNNNKIWTKIANKKIIAQKMRETKQNSSTKYLTDILTQTHAKEDIVLTGLAGENVAGKAT